MLPLANKRRHPGDEGAALPKTAAYRPNSSARRRYDLTCALCHRPNKLFLACRDLYSIIIGDENIEAGRCFALNNLEYFDVQNYNEDQHWHIEYTNNFIIEAFLERIMRYGMYSFVIS